MGCGAAGHAHVRYTVPAAVKTIELEDDVCEKKVPLDTGIAKQGLSMTESSLEPGDRRPHSAPRPPSALGADASPVLLIAHTSPQRKPSAPSMVRLTPPTSPPPILPSASAPQKKPALAGPLLPAAAITRRQQTPVTRVPCAFEDTDYERALEFVAEVPVLRSLPKADVPLLVQVMTKHEFFSGETVIEQGEMNECLFIILSGTAEVVQVDNSTDQVLVRLGMGDYFGEQELLHATVARATVRAVSTLITFSVAHGEFWRVGLEKHLRIPKRRAVLDVRAAKRQLSLEGRGALAFKDKEASRLKTDEERQVIGSALRANVYLPSFCILTDKLVEQLVAASVRCTFSQGEEIMKQGDLHAGRFYVVQQGCFDIRGRGRRGTTRELSGSWEATAGPGKSFGELELLYSAPAMATVTACEPSVAWMICHSDFTNILSDVLETRLERYVEQLRRVQMFSCLYHQELRALAEAVTEVSYRQGEDILQQGTVSSTFFVLLAGKVAVLRDGERVHYFSGSCEEETADFFGEEELLRPGPRIATVRVVSETAIVLALDKASFDLILQPLDELVREMNEKGSARVSPSKTDDEHLKQGVQWWASSLKSEGSNAINWEDLEHQGCIGAGGFSSVELMQHRPSGQRFALKRLSRKSLSEPWLRRRAFAEKAILTMTCSPFIIQLHRTFRDSQALSFLLELGPAGDLLHAFCRFELYGSATCARFYSAGAARALVHLHERRIIHRDLKPENLLLDARGWPKLSDFGLAKFCVGKAFTVCGTPNYMAPETLLQLGSCEAVDWWAFGVLVYEMMAATTPFENDDVDDTRMCKRIQRGIPEDEDWPWPRHFGPELRMLVTSLLRPRPSERLTMRPGGLVNLEEHPWFRDFDWVRFAARVLDPPCVGLAEPSTPMRLIAGFEEMQGGISPSSSWDAEF